MRIVDEETNEWKEPCVKIFRNGSFQITGIRTPLQMNSISLMTHKFIVDSKSYTTETPPPVSELTTKICMMNSDFSFPFRIKRRELQQIISSQTQLQTSFESTNYQGVNIKFFYNERNDYNSQGICSCEKACKGDGDGTAGGQCRRITIAPFQTGKIIITGARNTDQLNTAYEKISNIILKNVDEINDGNKVDKKVKTFPRIIQCHQHKMFTIEKTKVLNIVQE